MTETTKTVNIKLTNGARVLLAKTLSAPGWYEKSIKDLMPAIALLERVELGEEVQDNEKWLTTETEFSLSLNEHKAGQHCLKFFIARAGFGPSVHIRNLLLEFEVET